MKKLVFSILFSLLCSVPIFAQAPALQRQYTFTATGNSDAYGFSGTGIGLHRMQWQLVNGTASSCTVALQGSDDGSTWTTIITAVTCTSSGQTSYVASSYSQVRFNMSALTLGTARGVQLTWSGYIPAPIAVNIDPTAGSTPLGVLGSASLFGPGLWTNIFSNEASAAANPTNVTATTTPGILISLTINKKATQTPGETSANVTCYDTATTGTVANRILILDTYNGSGTYVYNIKTANGIGCSNIGSQNVTMAYK